MNGIEDLRVKIFADGANLEEMLKLARKPYIKGFTTNPTLMREAGVRSYERFAREMLDAIPDRPISFEVLSDQFDEMERQGRLIASWAENVYVKIPVTNTRGESSASVISSLTGSGVKVNVTALCTVEQVRRVAAFLTPGVPSSISIFAGRVADTGRDPVPVIAEAVQVVSPLPGVEIIWASPRELLNIFQADTVGCHTITVTVDILRKLPLIGKDLDEYSLDTVKMFYNDACQAGLCLGEPASLIGGS